MAEYDFQINRYDGINAAWDQLNPMTKANDVKYLNETSGLASTEVQGAIDELASRKSGGVDTFSLYMMGGFWK